MNSVNMIEYSILSVMQFNGTNFMCYKWLLCLLNIYNCLHCHITVSGIHYLIRENQGTVIGNDNKIHLTL